MSFSLHSFNQASLLRFLAVMMLGCATSYAQQGVVTGEGVSDADLEVKELRAALAATQKRLAASEASLARSEGERQALLAATTQAKLENADLRKAYSELTLRLEARGSDSLGADDRGLEQRLLKAVRNYDLSQTEVEQLTAQLMRLSEAAITSMEIEGEAMDKLLVAEVNVSTALINSITSKRGASENVGFAEGRVVSLEPSIGLVVLNVGKKSGARIGMPIEVLRDGRPVASAVVVDVRDGIAGAVLSVLNSSNDSVKIGDSVRPQPQAL